MRMRINKLTQGFSEMAAGSLSQSQCDFVGAQPGLPMFNLMLLECRLGYR